MSKTNSDYIKRKKGISIKKQVAFNEKEFEIVWNIVREKIVPRSEVKILGDLKLIMDSPEINYKIMAFYKIISQD